MKNLIILVPNGPHNLISVAGAYKILNRAEKHWQSLGNKCQFSIQLAGLSTDVAIEGGLFSLHPKLLSKIGQTDFIIIPSIDHNYVSAIENNQKLIAWILNKYKKGAEVASICTGAFLLAATGLLDNKRCSTHWIATEAFREMFPKVVMATDSVITDEDGIYTNGGAFSFLNLMIYLIEKFYGRETAIYCSKIFQIDMERNSQSPFTIFTGQKHHDDTLIKEAQNRIEKDFTEKIVFEELASELAVSRRNFDRRFVQATGNTPVEYWQRVKIEAAKRHFETSRKNINEVMYEVGYSDNKTFRNVFKKITGLSPWEYRRKYNKEAVAS